MSLLRIAAAAAFASVVACGPDALDFPKEPSCPPPPEPARQSMVVGTIGKMHLVESRYPLARLGDAFAAFRPDLVLVGVRPEAFGEGRLEEAPFEMTYAHHLAKASGVPVEPIDWFRDEELDAPPAPVDPFDVVEIERREAAVLRAPKLYTFERANGSELAEQILLATKAAARHRKGDPLAARRRAWVEHLAADAVLRHQRPKRVLAFVDVLDRPAVDLVLRGFGYHGVAPAEEVANAKEVLADGDLPSEVMAAYRAQLARATERAESGDDGAKRFWQERARVLEVVVEKGGACCVPQARLAPARASED